MRARVLYITINMQLRCYYMNRQATLPSLCYKNKKNKNNTKWITIKKLTKCAQSHKIKKKRWNNLFRFAINLDACIIIAADIWMLEDLSKFIAIFFFLCIWFWWFIMASSCHAITNYFLNFLLGHSLLLASKFMKWKSYVCQNRREKKTHTN